MNIPSAELVKLEMQMHHLFKNKEYEKLISCFNEAITKNPSDPKYYTNRALCKLKLRQLEDCASDCRHALEVDPSHIKAHFFLGQFHNEAERYDEAIASYKKALDLAKEQKANFGDDIARALREAKRKKWEIQDKKRVEQEIELQNYLTKLMEEDKQRKLSSLEDKIKEDEEEEKKDSKTVAAKKIEDNYEKHKKELNRLFEAVDDRRKKRDPPDYLCGKISFVIMRDPVITPSGITYDRKDIEEHLQRVGHFDPVTRCKLTQDQLINNLAMKDVIDTFVRDNEWVEDW